MTIREHEHQQQRKPKRYLTKPQVARRYAKKATISVDRGWQQ
jgi:hypothetical protein